MSAVSVMTALAAVLPTGTSVAAGSVYVQQGLSAVASTTGTWPVLILNAPHRRRERETLGPQGYYQWTHDVLARYLDKWETQSATYEAILGRADAALQIMVDNLSTNPNLVIDGQQYGRDGADQIEAWLDGRVDYKDLGFPVIQARLLLRIQDVWSNYDVSVS